MEPPPSSTDPRQESNAAFSSAPRELTDRQIFDKLSRSSVEAFRVADAIRRAVEERVVHLEYLLLGLTVKQDGPVDAVLRRAGVEVGRWIPTLSGLQKRPLPPPFSLTRAPLVGLPDHSPHVHEALRIAVGVAKGEFIEARHLLFGALSVADAPAVRAVRKLGIGPELVDLGDDAGAVDPKSFITRLLADGLEGKPLLGINREVAALCSVLASTDVEPPISVGLFGNWGSGKSFFMKKMEERFNLIRDRARKEPGSPWCANIVQVKFNAWHYIDTNLWANLTSEVFEQLSAALADPNKAGDLTRERLLAVAASSRDVLGEAERKKKAAEEELRAGEERLKNLKTDARSIENESTPEEIRRQVWKELSTDEGVAEEIRKIAARLNIPALEAGAQSVNAQVLEIRSLGHGVKEILKSLLKPGSTVLWLVSLAFAGAVFAAGRYFSTELAGLGETLGRVATGLGAAAAFLAPIVAKAQSVVSAVKRVKSAHEEAITQKAEKRKDDLRKEQDELRVKVGQAERQIQEATKKVQEVEEQLAALQADRQMYQFIQERHVSKDYTQYLGLIAKARSDFQRLSELMQRVKTEKFGDEKAPLPRIDRIILYIDDLDRCPETKVVEVLQAVHLLLAFPLFIVVVGVDPRWLLHSLRMHSVAFRQKDGMESGLTPEEIDQWRTTPLNYLEKIFQIPYTLRPMTPTGFNELIDQWKVAATKKGEEDDETGGTGDAGPGEKDEQDETLTEEEKIRRKEKKKDDDPPPSLLPLPEPVRIEPHEWEFMKLLGPLIATPRAAKRFVNVYRLLRASLDPARRARFVEDSFQPAQVLLAMVMGHPEAASEIVGGLIQENPPGRWWDYVEKFRPAKGSAPADGEDSAHALFKDVDVIKAVLPDIPCKAVRDLVPDVARYSFRSGRLLLESAV